MFCSSVEICRLECIDDKSKNQDKGDDDDQQVFLTILYSERIYNIPALDVSVVNILHIFKIVV